VRVLIAAVLLVSACAPVARPSPSPESQTASPIPIVTATTTPTTATPTPTPIAPVVPAAQLDPPIVALAATPFPIAPTLALTRAAVGPADESAARWGIEQYLQGLDRYRDFGDYLPARGAFGEAVAAALVASRTPGVKRTFVLQSLRIEGLYRKPWGTQALADVRVTIADHAVDRSSPDQLEMGLLRLSGDRRLQVIDSWDETRGRWFNGRVPDDPAGLREGIEQAVGTYLRTESWLNSAPATTYYDGTVEATPFTRARAAYVGAFDRAATPSRTFAGVTGAVERYDTFADLAGGIAAVRIVATVVTTDASGRTQHQPVTRSVKVFFGNWIPMAIDEEVTPGVWRSGGDLALLAIDVNWA
jgi:hypothetical protein